MNPLCETCGFRISTDCDCEITLTEKGWEKARAMDKGCPICGKAELHWCDTKSGRYAFLRDEFGNRISSHYLPADFPMPEMPENAAPDMVNHPPHYTTGAVECIDAIRAALGDDGMVAYCRGNAIKYLWRTGKKGDAVQDMEKAVWYITKAVEVAREDR